MPEWLTALQRRHGEGLPSILVTVADAQGSTPRAAGARMAVGADSQYDTIGGGHLEWRAIEIAQEMLSAAAGECAPVLQPHLQPVLQRFPLGPSLGQCCGGAVQLRFERIAADAAGAAAIAELTLAWEQERATHPQVILFGAGHVGRALAALLGGLPCRLLWVDQREDFFPAALPPNAAIEVTEHPEDIVGDAAPGSYYLVMTHSHAVDQLLSERILQRGDAAWFGLIGSETKRRLFQKRLALRGLSERQLAGMTCPIGVEGITGKEPASIAIAVAAQLLLLWEQAASSQGPR
ncbi:xanthine dehydrogenase accessory protein XdhC [Oxalobacteraceae bacterium CAVE-383]|nr:xanthine dehydrogenase accessory protein XdhC [Oxalobacteraceae bacterium CAVE-383]